MKEITRITTVEITEVGVMPEEVADYCTDEKAKESYKSRLKDELKKMLGADDVNVTNVQDFIKDLEVEEMKNIQLNMM